MRIGLPAADRPDHGRRPAVLPSPPRGAAEASTRRLTKPGRVSVISCATKLPIEKPN
jgi:hypothetical protein